MRYWCIIHLHLFPSLAIPLAVDVFSQIPHNNVLHTSRLTVVGTIIVLTSYSDFRGRSFCTSYACADFVCLPFYLSIHWWFRPISATVYFICAICVCLTYWMGTCGSAFQAAIHINTTKIRENARKYVTQKIFRRPQHCRRWIYWAPLNALICGFQ